jgi:hypothetical protein
VQRVEHLVALGADGEVLDRDDQRRLGDDPRLAVDDLRELRGGGEPARAAGGVERALGALHDLGVPRGAEQLERVVDVEVGVPDVEGPHRGEACHRGAVLLDGAGGDLVLLLLLEAVGLGRDHHARREALDVPLPGPGERFVKVVDVEDEPTFGRGEDAEVRDVGVAAELSDEAGARRQREVGGHDLRRAAVEGERRGEHPAEADRDELLHARRVLALEELDRVGALRRRVEGGVALARDVEAGGLAAGGALGGARLRRRRVVGLGRGLGGGVWRWFAFALGHG